MPSSNDAERDRGAKCPICGKPTVLALRPFCSKRCADIDLGRWLGGRYAVAGHADTEEDGEVESESKDTPPPARELN